MWDYDAVSNVVLFDVHQNAETIPAAGEAGKVGWVFIVDRRSGKLIRRSDPYVMMSKNMFTTPTHAGVDMLPGANGGAEWSPPAFSPQTHCLYILAMDQLMQFTTKPTASAPGLIRLDSAFTNIAPGGRYSERKTRYQPRGLERPHADPRTLESNQARGVRWRDTSSALKSL